MHQLEAEGNGGVPTANTYSRRKFLRNTIIGAAGVGALTAAGGLTAPFAGASRVPQRFLADKSLGSLTVQLQWIENFNWAGMYIAEHRGYYKTAGLSSVTLLPGGPNVVPETIVLAGKADVGFSSADAIASANLQGAGFKIFATQYQKNPFGIMSLASKPIKTPKDMIGKRIGLSSENSPELLAFLSLNKIAASQITQVPVGFDPVSAFATNQIDGCLSFAENPIELQAAGYKTEFFLLAEYGYNIISDSYFATQKTIDTESAKLKALLVGDIMGWTTEINHPSIGAELGLQEYGKLNNLVSSTELPSAKIQTTIAADSDTKKYGMLSLSPSLREQNIKSLAAGGVHITEKQLFDTSIIDAVYKEHPALLTSSPA